MLVINESLCTRPFTRYFTTMLVGCLASIAPGTVRAAEPQAESTAKTSQAKIEYQVGQSGSRLVPSLATHHFEITTDSPKAQAWFDQGLILTYGFNHGEAIRAFQEAAALDPDAAMAWWGIAYANGMHINIPEMDEDQWRDSHAAAQRALAELDNESELERALIQAVAKRTAWPVPKEQAPFDQAYGEAMERV